MKVEIRNVAASLRAAGDAARTLVGRAITYNVLSSAGVPFAGMREKVAPGAFAQSVARDDIRGLFNHDANCILARTKNGTLTLTDTPSALQFSMRLPDTRAAQDLYTLVRRGDIDGCSFGFLCEDDDWDDGTDPDDGSRIKVRTIRRGKLADVRAVTYPAYSEASATTVAARSRGWAYGAPAIRNTRRADAEFDRMLDELSADLRARVAADDACAARRRWWLHNAAAIIR